MDQEQLPASERAMCEYIKHALDETAEQEVVRLKNSTTLEVNLPNGCRFLVSVIQLG